MSNGITFNYELKKIGECIGRIKQRSYQLQVYRSDGARAGCDREMIREDLENIEYWTREMKQVLHLLGRKG